MQQRPTWSVWPDGRPLLRTDQQLLENPGGAAAGFFTFSSCVAEDSAMALLDLQAKPGLKHIQGLQQVVISDYMNADSLTPHFGVGKAPVVSV